MLRETSTRLGSGWVAPTQPFSDLAAPGRGGVGPRPPRAGQ